MYTPAPHGAGGLKQQVHSPVPYGAGKNGRSAKKINVPCLTQHRGVHFFYGAGDGTRTHTLSPAADFESATSTNSITPAHCILSSSKNKVDYTPFRHRMQEEFSNFPEIFFGRGEIFFSDVNPG